MGKRAEDSRKEKKAIVELGLRKQFSNKI